MKSKITNKTIKYIVVAVLICILGVSIVRQIVTMNKIQEQITQKQEQIDKLKKDNEALKDEVSKSTSDDFIEKQARERLNMIKPGEKVVVQKQN